MTMTMTMAVDYDYGENTLCKRPSITPNLTP